MQVRRFSFHCPVPQQSLKSRIAAVLNVGKKTIKRNRAHIMEKMMAGSLAALVKMAAELSANTRV